MVSSTARCVLAEGVGFEPTVDVAAHNGFRVLSGSCYPVRLVLFCVIWFCQHVVYKGCGPVKTAHIQLTYYYCICHIIRSYFES